MVSFTEAELRAVRYACCSHEGSLSRWQQLAASGATDAEIVERLNREFGLGGGSWGPCGVSESHQQNPPRVWLYVYQDVDTITLKGQELIALVRRLFQVHQPAPAGQLALFEEH